ncbi:polynucleotide 3'-phosphatase [Rhodotorula toruloides]|uniref:Polynucleotide 3'-phosphatase n=1 Tax=Rhodotorula toruloides TaxID=5286 RepID=A0A511K8H9_RHOTO|nr:polynucleotide 3'-phosphatase [Rhodotorula toruloides]
MRAELPRAASSTSFPSLPDTAPSSPTSRLPTPPAGALTVETPAPPPSKKRANAYGQEGGRDKGKLPSKRDRKPAGIQGKWWPTLHSRTGQGRGCGHYVWGEPAPSSKVAAFDLDGTVIRPMNGNSFPKDSYDWELYAVVLLTNQASPFSDLSADFRRKIPFVCRRLSVPLHVFACFEFDEYRKPAMGMWQAFVERFNGGLEVDYNASFYVGDAAGRPADHADTDRKFSLNVGLRFFTPEECFEDAPPDNDYVLWGWDPFAYDHSTPDPPAALSLAPLPDTTTHELVLLLGGPASGKTHYYETHLQPQRYERISFLPQRNSELSQQLKQRVSDHFGRSRSTDNSSPPEPRPLRLAIETPLASAFSRRLFLRNFANLLLSIRGVPRSSFKISAVVFAPADESISGKGGIELWRHNSVWRSVTSGKGVVGDRPRERAVSLTPIEHLRKWEREWEEPTLEEGFHSLSTIYFRLPSALQPSWKRWLADVYPGKARKTGRIAVYGPGARKDAVHMWEEEARVEEGKELVGALEVPGEDVV